jgi:hypothetical protein
MSLDTEIRELYDRVRAIEASPAGGGIKFDTYPQAGDWLYAGVTGFLSDDPVAFAALQALPGWVSAFDGLSMLLHAPDTGSIALWTQSAGQIYLRADDNGTIRMDAEEITAVATDQLLLDGGTSAVLQSSSGGVIISGATLVVVESPSSTLLFESSFDSTSIYSGLAGSMFVIPPTGVFALRTSDSGTNALMAMFGDGSFHIVDPTTNDDILRITPGTPYTYEIKAGSVWTASL